MVRLLQLPTTLSSFSPEKAIELIRNNTKIVNETTFAKFFMIHILLLLDSDITTNPRISM
jgi:hypothetical protein